MYVLVKLPGDARFICESFVYNWITALRLAPEAFKGGYKVWD